MEEVYGLDEVNKVQEINGQYTFRSPYTLVQHHRSDYGNRQNFTLTVVVYLCGASEKLEELQTRVALALPKKDFSIRFNFDYINIIRTSSGQKRGLEKNIVQLVMMGHHALHKSTFFECGNDLIFVK